MNQLKQYWQAVKPRDYDTHYSIEKSLSGPPGDWRQIIKDEFNNIQTFLDKFSRRYWNEQAQHGIRRKLEFGAHRGGKTGLRAEYAIRLYAKAKELRPSMSPREIIQKLARHYNEEIKYAIVGRGIMHIDGLVELLENFDRIGPINANKEEERERQSQDEIKHNQQMIQSQISMEGSTRRKSTRFLSCRCRGTHMEATEVERKEVRNITHMKK